jgi:hypothetical protein
VIISGIYYFSFGARSIKQLSGFHHFPASFAFEQTTTVHSFPLGDPVSFSNKTGSERRASRARIINQPSLGPLSVLCVCAL